jgi:hypothetical protein
MSSDTPDEWASVALYNLATYQNGRPTKPAEVTAAGVPVIKIAELTRGITAATNHVAPEAVEERHVVREGDLLFAWSGSVGIHIFRGPNAALNQHIFQVQAKSGINQAFLRYLLEGQMELFHRLVAGKRTTMGHVTVPSHPVLTGRSIRPRRFVCRVSRRQVWPEPRRVVPARVATRRRRGARCAGARGARRGS